MIGRQPAAGLRYVPAGQLGDTPHVVVDGAPRAGTVLTLSHWPGTPTPPRLWADTSAEIVLGALGQRRLLPRRVEVATIDHYDADGVIALGLLVLDGLAETAGPCLVAAARTGDFDVVEDRRDALVAFALAALEAPDTPGASANPDAPDDGARDAPDDGARPEDADVTVSAAHRALAVLPELARRPAAFEHLWGPEAEAFDRARAMVAAGAVAIEEEPALDLAVVRVDSGHPDATGARWQGAPLHRGAVHSGASCLRVATVAGDRYELRYRYESWVRLVSRRPRPRVDLSQLAASLTEMEADGGPWCFEGAGAITPALRRADDGPSTLSPERFLDEVARALAVLDQGPPAWDPFAGGAAY